MGVFEMIVGIVLITSVSSVMLARMRLRHKEAHGRSGPETERLRDEVRQLKERLAVIERITVERENSLERQIESLRDR
jgi:1,6-anhydro-N-acetylmuramate kinase